MSSENQKVWQEILSIINNIEIPNGLIIEDELRESLEKSCISIYKALPIEGRDNLKSKKLTFKFTREFFDDYLSDPDQMAPVLKIILVRIKEIIQNFNFDTSTHECIDEWSCDTYVITELGNISLMKKENHG